MKKQVIKMTQNGLQKLISESVRRILKEAEKATGVIGYEEDLPDGWVKYTDDNGKTSYFDEDYNEYIKTYTNNGQERLVPVSDFGNTEFGDWSHRGNMGKKATYKPIKGSLKPGDFSQLDTEYSPYAVPSVKNREHTNLDDCTDTIRRIHTIKDPHKREMALQYLYMDLKKDVLRYGKGIYMNICAEKAVPESLINSEELESLILRALNISLGIEENKYGTTKMFNPNKLNIPFKVYISKKIEGVLRNYIGERKKRLFTKVEKDEADALIFNELTLPAEKSDLLLDVKERDEFLNKVRKNRAEAADEAWDILAPERTFMSFEDIPFNGIPNVFRVLTINNENRPEIPGKKYKNYSTTLSIDQQSGLSLSNDNYTYYVPIETDEFADMSDETLANTLADNVSSYDYLELPVQKVGKSDKQVASESINRIVRKVLMEMRKK